MQESDLDADLWANWYGFESAAEMQDWHKEVERERLAELTGEAKEAAP